MSKQLSDFQAHAEEWGGRMAAALWGDIDLRLIGDDEPCWEPVILRTRTHTDSDHLIAFHLHSQDGESKLRFLIPKQDILWLLENPVDEEEE